MGILNVVLDIINAVVQQRVFGAMSLHLLGIVVPFFQ
jgi:hypothetical protein